MEMNARRERVMSKQLPGRLERRAWPVEELRVSQGDNGEPLITWFPAVFDSLSEDLGGFRERIFRGAFNKTIRDADIRALFNHDANFVLGRNRAKPEPTLSLETTSHGLRAAVTPPDTQWSRDLMVSIDRGDISSGSFGFQVVKDRWSIDHDTDTVIRELQEVRLYDVSLVVFPAYPGTDGSVALRSALAAIDIEADDILYPLLRSVLAASNQKIEDLIQPLLRARAGVPLDQEAQERVNDIIARLRSPISAPPTPEGAGRPSVEEPPTPESAGHPVRNAIRRRQLQLIALKGGSAHA